MVSNGNIGVGLILLFKRRTYGLTVKYRIYIPIMECEHCTKPNLFDCLIIHGEPIPIKCHKNCKEVWLV